MAITATLDDDYDERHWNVPDITTLPVAVTLRLEYVEIWAGGTA